MKKIRIYKKLIGILVPMPFLMAMTFCCCLDKMTSAEEAHSSVFTEHHEHGVGEFDHNEPHKHEVEKADPSEHHEHSDNDSCACPKHLSFTNSDSIDITFSSLNQMLAKYLMAHLEFERFSLYSSLSNQTHGPPVLDHARYASLPIYLKISNLRL